MEQYAAPHQAPAEGEIESGQVVAITDLGVVVNLGAKTEGLIPAQEFAVLDGPFPLLAGQPVEVQRTGERKEGMVLLSYQRVKRRRVWGKIEEAYRTKSDINGKIVDHIKGGPVVDIGVRAFLPASQADLHPVRDLDEWKGRELAVRVLKMNRKRGNVVVSRRAILDEQVASQRQAMLDSLAEGQTVRGVVKNVTGYGAFVDLGGIDGLLHITDMSWGRVASPLDAVSPGEEVDVKILKYDKEKGRVSLGRKQLLPDPWASVVERYTKGTKLTGKIMGLADYGAFVELEPGIEGLVHVSEMSWSKRKQHPSKIVNLGDDAEVIVLGVDSNERRISLGMKQAQSDPWQQLAEKYPVGTVVKGSIRNLDRNSGPSWKLRKLIRRPYSRQRHFLDRANQESLPKCTRRATSSKPKVLKIDQEHRGAFRSAVKQVRTTSGPRGLKNTRLATWCAEEFRASPRSAPSSSWPTASKGFAIFRKSTTAAARVATNRKARRVPASGKAGCSIPAAIMSSK